MASGTSVLGWLFALGLIAAIVLVVSFIYFGLRDDHRTGDYHFTWGVGVVVLFLLGFAPGLVGLGLYATVERDFPTYWLFASVALAVLVVGALGAAVSTVTVAG